MLKAGRFGGCLNGGAGARACFVCPTGKGSGGRAGRSAQSTGHFPHFQGSLSKVLLWLCQAKFSGYKYAAGDKTASRGLRHGNGLCLGSKVISLLLLLLLKIRGHRLPTLPPAGLWFRGGSKAALPSRSTRGPQTCTPFYALDALEGWGERKHTLPPPPV